MKLSPCSVADTADRAQRQFERQERLLRMYGPNLNDRGLRLVRYVAFVRWLDMRAEPGKVEAHPEMSRRLIREAGL